MEKTFDVGKFWNCNRYHATSESLR